MRRRIDTGRQAVQHPEHLRRKRAGVLNALLRAPQLRRGDHLHRLGDLLRRLDGPHPSSDIQ
jgi:hypothetical protein